jgi:predicted anti-sigma-YlaC factor YlaD
MIDNRKEMSCEAFQEQLAELIGTGADVSSHAHLQNCDLCRAFFADLEAIAAVARELFPVEDPSDRVWEQIQSAIQEEEGKTSAK